MNAKQRKLIYRILPYAILTGIGICFVLPLLWVLVASVDPNAMQSLKMPSKVTGANYVEVMTSSENQRAYLIGLVMSLGQAVLVVLLALLAAYPLSRYQMKYKKPFMLTILFMTSLPITAVMVPVYQLFLGLKLYDNILGVILFYVASSMPYGIWMMKNFMDSVPSDLEEAAWVDGASVFTGMRKVVAPLMVPGICTVAIFTFSGSWGNFFVPYILLQSPEKFPASLKLYQFFGQYGMVDYGSLAAFSVLYAIPAIIMYILSQQFMSKGFGLQGGTKG
ncbi:carbohydrate ABC transporter permease [Virgibacillus sp. LDC1]|uniref:carbohydrate ABC transporter permease n=1 Tax=Paenibacillus TaxID=44249 RepID=UPI000BF70519|nr:MULTISPECIES: carbohydrate ABC transporter permease [Paenibacillus]MCV4232728.1 carbohydrate ABC transporter permease [Virgibacillus sp. LDC1]MEC0258279.1 carbohydrate ABC transporter permease [Paenibacillus lautus]MEC0308739.1 carbohydrate ABC transporter permease [Paenibacillus lautus]PJN56720.1 Trehalose transport system permease protein SugB [Paenibacillus sp. GM2FR]GIO95745.1 sugar ABC transporter permease [Paenibacillus lautus]